MSVQSNTYVLVGVKLPFEHFNEDQRESHEDYTDSSRKGIHHHNGLCVIGDGMSGEYYFIGRVIAKSIDEHGEGIRPQDISTSAMLDSEVRFLLHEHFGLQDAEVRTWAFTHYR